MRIEMKLTYRRRQRSSRLERLLLGRLAADTQRPPMPRFLVDVVFKADVRLDTGLD
uniref:Uncharacterized protein n=1 Tax=metagenome TaxID=256318 RepID=A0A2P2C0Z1_9ZZZZ